MFSQKIRSLRGYLGLSREAFSKKSGIPRETLNQWENNRRKNISEKSVQRIIAAFEQEGIFCTREWLLNDEGDSPLERSANHLPRGGQDEPSPPPDEIINFCSQYPAAKIHYITDNTMYPAMLRGDVLACLPIEESKVSCPKIYLLTTVETKSL